jgi:hypothetical protein
MEGAMSIRSILSGKPVVITGDELAKWKKCRRQFRCSLCGHSFGEGDVIRFVMGRGKTVNFFTCSACDGDDVHDRFVAAIEESKRRFWWLYEQIEQAQQDR